jgi:protein-S-isoprenylcysteine O-methyltransferase Ste14
MIRVHPVLAAVLVIGFAAFVFWRVRIDYAIRGRLTPLSAILQFLVFLLHALASYSFLDSGASTVWTESRYLPLALGLMAVGIVAVLAGMAQLRLGDTLGRSAKGLKKSGTYRFSRNPQLVAYFMFLAGYVLLRPTWLGSVWLALYGVIAHVMVLTEEGHLRRTFGEEYEDYCRSTPRYVGVPRRA